jgi:hypothetical protein
VRVLSVEVVNRHPFQSSTKVRFHPPHQLASQLLQIDAVSKLRRDNELPQSGIALLLPSVQHWRGINTGTDFTESSCPVKRRAFACDISTVSSPLPSYFVFGIGDAHRAPLIELFSGPRH